jgi:hypothetical protein
MAERLPSLFERNAAEPPAPFPAKISSVIPYDRFVGKY